MTFCGESLETLIGDVVVVVHSQPLALVPVTTIDVQGISLLAEGLPLFTISLAT